MYRKLRVSIARLWWFFSQLARYCFFWRITVFSMGSTHKRFRVRSYSIIKLAKVFIALLRLHRSARTQKPFLVRRASHMAARQVSNHRNKPTCESGQVCHRVRHLYNACKIAKYVVSAVFNLSSSRVCLSCGVRCSIAATRHQNPAMGLRPHVADHPFHQNLRRGSSSDRLLRIQEMDQTERVGSFRIHSPIRQSNWRWAE